MVKELNKDIHLHLLESGGVHLEFEAGGVRFIVRQKELGPVKISWMSPATKENNLIQIDPWAGPLKVEGEEDTANVRLDLANNSTVNVAGEIINVK